MPFGNGTGPRGLGPRTGRGLGYCSGYSYPGYMNSYGFGWGRGFGRGWGRGLGRGWGWPAYPYPPEPPTPKEEKEMSFDELRSSLAQRFAWATEDLKALREEMKAIEERMKELETPKESKLPTGQAKKTKK